MGRYLRMAVRLILLGAVVTAGSPRLEAQAPPATLRVANVSQWLLNRYGGTVASPDARLLELLERGVVDRAVFSWQRDRIPREALVDKPVRVLPAAEAATLGGRGAFRLAGILPRAGTAAWTEIQVVPETARPGDVLVVEIGGEMNVTRQVLETILIASPHGLRALPLAPAALFAGPGVPVVRRPFGRPVTLAPGADPFRGADGVDLLVARSLVPAHTNATVTASGPADMASDTTIGDWREADRVFVRVALETLRASAPGIVLAWKDRVEKPDPGDRNDIFRFERPE